MLTHQTGIMRQRVCTWPAVWRRLAVPVAGVRSQLARPVLRVPGSISAKPRAVPPFAFLF